MQVRYAFDDSKLVEKTAKSRGQYLRVHFKNTRETAAAVNGMKLQTAYKYLATLSRRSSASPSAASTAVSAAPSRLRSSRPLRVSSAQRSFRASVPKEEGQFIHGKRGSVRRPASRLERRDRPDLDSVISSREDKAKTIMRSDDYASLFHPHAARGKVQPTS